MKKIIVLFFVGFVCISADLPTGLVKHSRVMGKQSDRKRVNRLIKPQTSNLKLPTL